MNRVILVFLLAVACGLGALADSLYTKDGRTFRGRVISQSDDKILFETDSGDIKMRMEFRSSEVEKLVKEDFPKPKTQPAASRPTTAPATGKSGEPTPPAIVKYDKPTYYLIPLRGEVGKTVQAQYLEKALADAVARQPTVVVIHMDSPGGLTNEVEPIVTALEKYQRKLHVVVLVKRAMSAAAISSLACKQIYMQPMATFGAATAFQIGPSGMPADVDEKFRSAWRATGRAAAEVGGHEPLLAEAMIDARQDLHVEVGKDGKKVIRSGRGDDMLVSQGKLLAMTAKEALNCGLSSGTVSDVEELGSVLGHDGWVECKGLGVLLADYNDKMLAEGEDKLKDLKKEFEEAMKQARANDPTKFRYEVFRNGKFTPESAKKWQTRSAVCSRFLGKAEAALEKAAKIADKYVQLASDSEGIRHIKSEIDGIRLQMQKEINRKGAGD